MSGMLGKRICKLDLSSTLARPSLLTKVKLAVTPGIDQLTLSIFLVQMDACHDLET